MKIIIVGGGKLAYYLIKTLKPNRHDITLIELEKSLCDRIATDFDDINVFNGDGTSIQVLSAVGCQHADFYVAVTGKDENNLVGCQVAKMRFGVRVTVARVNNPKNLEMFDRLGVSKVFSSTQILADIIEQEIDFSGMRIVFSIPNTTKEIVEFQLSPKSTACNQNLQQYHFPGDSKVVIITHNDGRVEMPHGNQVMHANDTILLVCDESELNNVWKTMVRQ